MADYEEQDGPADAGEAIDEIRRFTWAAGDMSAQQKAVAIKLDALRGEFAAAREALARANDLAHRLAQQGMSISRADMEALRAGQRTLIEAMRETFGEADRIRERFWMGAFGLGIAGGLFGGGIAVAAPFIIRGFMS